MARQSTIHRLPRHVREELDRRLLEEHHSQMECTDWLKKEGHRISKSAVNRYAVMLFSGLEDLKLLSVSGQPLGQAVAKAVAHGDDDELPGLIEDLIGHQVRQLAILRKIQSLMKKRRQEITAGIWAKDRKGTG